MISDSSIEYQITLSLQVSSSHDNKRLTMVENIHHQLSIDNITTENFIYTHITQMQSTKLANFTIQRSCISDPFKKYQKTNLIKEKIRVEMSFSEEVSATRTVTLVLQMRHDTHIAKTMAARREEGILDNLHAYRAENVFLRPPILRSRWRSRGSLFRLVGLHHGHQSAD